MSTVPTSSVALDEGDTFPRSWSWEEDGESLSGFYREFGEATTAYGLKPFVVLRLESGELVTLWLFHEALLSQFAGEISRRPEGDLSLEEPVTVERGELRESASGRTYRDYRVRFPEAPRRSPREILGLPEPGEPAAADEVDGADAAGAVPF